MMMSVMMIFPNFLWLFSSVSIEWINKLPLNARLNAAQWLMVAKSFSKKIMNNEWMERGNNSKNDSCYRKRNSELICMSAFKTCNVGNCVTFFTNLEEWDNELWFYLNQLLALCKKSNSVRFHCFIIHEIFMKIEQKSNEHLQPQRR